MMPAGRGNLERAFGALLPLDIALVELAPGRFTHFRLRPRQHLRALELVGDLDQRNRGDDLDSGLASAPQAIGQIRPSSRALAPVAAGDRGD